MYLITLSFQLTRRASEDVLFGNRHANRQGLRNPFSQPVHTADDAGFVHIANPFTIIS